MNLRETILELEKVYSHIENNDFSLLQINSADLLAETGLLTIIEGRRAPILSDKSKENYEAAVQEEAEYSKERERLEIKLPLLRRIFQSKEEKIRREKEIKRVREVQYNLRNEIIFMKNHSLMNDERYVGLTNTGKRIRLNFAVEGVGEHGLHLEPPTSDVDIRLLMSKWDKLDYGITPIHHAAKTLGVPIDELLFDTQIRLCKLIRFEKTKFEENHKGNKLNTNCDYTTHYENGNDSEIYGKLAVGIIDALVEAYKVSKHHGNFGLVISDKETRLINPVSTWLKKTGEWDENGGSQYDSPDMHVSYEDSPLYAEIIPCEKKADSAVHETNH